MASVGSWFETREDALLTMRTEHEPHPEEHREAMRLEGWSQRKFLYSPAISCSVITVFQFRVVAPTPRAFSIAPLDSLVSP
jgi:hypothetical protein